MLNKTIVITGANTGIGRVTAIELAKRGACVILACRSYARTQPVLDEIAALGQGKATFLELDLGSLASTRAAADMLCARNAPVDILINNAGMAGKKGLTADGFELTFGTDHIGPFVFTRRLVPLLLRASAPRIVNVSSRSHYQTSNLDYSGVRMRTRSATGIAEYSLSKLANVLFATELQRRYSASGLRAYALHPGVIASDVWRHVPWGLRSLMKLFMISNEKGAQTTLHCATDESAEGGLYYDKSRPKPASPLATPEAAAELWRLSSEWTGESVAS
jgi:retinol dehydrogenase 12